MPQFHPGKMMKTIRKGIAQLFKTILLALLAVILVPILYFAWRTGQPMELPEFKGLTYYQFLEWRSIAHNEIEHFWTDAIQVFSLATQFCAKTCLK